MPSLDQIRAFAESRDLSIRQIALTKEGARQIIDEHEREMNAAIGDALLFEIDHKRADAKPHQLMTEAAIERMQTRGVL